MRRGLFIAAWLLAGCGKSNAPPPSPVVEVAAGGDATCARLEDGSTHCWGVDVCGVADPNVEPEDDTYIWLGATTYFYPKPVLAKVPAKSRQIVLGESHGCALKDDGTVACWGHNDNCQLGIGEAKREHKTEPVNVKGLAGVNALTASGSRTCALLSGGGARCWGDELDKKRCTPTDEPIPSDTVELATGSGFVCARKKGGTAWCSGQKPGVVAGLSGVEQIVVAGNSACARLSDGTARCWGDNRGGKLGVGDHERRDKPTMVKGLTDAIFIALGQFNGCAVVKAGAVRCWGDGRNIGDGSDGTEARYEATAVKDLKDAVALSVGGTETMQHVCALLKDGNVQCWGSDYFGQLGQDSRGFFRGQSSRVPVAVVW